MAASAMAAAACEPAPSTETTAAETPLPTVIQYPEIQYPPSVPPRRERLRFFSPHEARTVESLTARILPGTPEDPGAREAAVVVYIDYLLSIEEGYGERTFREPPFAQTYEGDQPPDEDTDFPTLWVPESEIKRYGYQHRLTPREVYRLALPLVDQYARDSFSADYADLSEQDQDSVIDDLYNNRVPGFDEFSPQSFFHVLRRHTDEGMFSDPAYGGNRDLVGWKMIGYPGAQRAYAPEDILSENPPRREVKSLDMLRHFNPGQRSNPNVIIPQRGADPHPGVR